MADQKTYPPPYQGGMPTPYPHGPPQGAPQGPQGYAPQQQQMYGAPGYNPGYNPQMLGGTTTVVHVSPTPQQQPSTTTIIVQRTGVNHCLHCCISLFFPPWVFVWIYLCIVN